jgi:hypothetical protein
MTTARTVGVMAFSTEPVTCECYVDMNHSNVYKFKLKHFCGIDKVNVVRLCLEKLT